MKIEPMSDGVEEFGGDLLGAEWNGTNSINKGQLKARFIRHLWIAEFSDLPTFPPDGYDEDDGEWVLDDPPFSFVQRSVQTDVELDVAMTMNGNSSGSYDSDTAWDLTGKDCVWFQAETVERIHQWVIYTIPVRVESGKWIWVSMMGGGIGGEQASECSVLSLMENKMIGKHGIGEFVLNE